MPVRVPPGRAKLSTSLPIHRIPAESEHHRRRRLGRPHAVDHQLLGDDDVGLHFQKLARNRFHVFPSDRPEQVDGQILPLDPAEVAQAAAQRFLIGRDLACLTEREECNASSTRSCLLSG
jgi:hypothetical protein